MTLGEMIIAAIIGLVVGCFVSLNINQPSSGKYSRSGSSKNPYTYSTYKAATRALWGKGPGGRGRRY